MYRADCNAKEEYGRLISASFAAGIRLGFGLFALQTLLEFLPCFGYSATVAFRIDPYCRALVMASGQFLLHVEIFTVSPEEDIARQFAKNREGMLEVLGNARIRTPAVLASRPGDNCRGQRGRQE